MRLATTPYHILRIVLVALFLVGTVSPDAEAQKLGKAKNPAIEKLRRANPRSRYGYRGLIDKRTKKAIDRLWRPEVGAALRPLRLPEDKLTFTDPIRSDIGPALRSRYPRRRPNRIRTRALPGNMIGVEIERPGGALDEVVVPEWKLLDRLNGPALQRSVLKEVARRIKKDAPVELQRDSPVDGSVLRRYVSGRVVEPRTSPEVYLDNWRRLEEFPESGPVWIFDLSPRTELALEQMSLDPKDVKVWQNVSARLKRAVDKYNSGKHHKNEVVLSRDVDQLFEALQIPDAVVIIYGHSNGRAILMDTQSPSEPIIPLARQELMKRLGTKRKKLAPVALLSCRARHVVSDALLSAGSPGVFAAPRPVEVEAVPKAVRAYLDLIDSGVSRIDAIGRAADKVKLNGLRFIGLNDIENRSRQNWGDWWVLVPVA